MKRYLQTFENFLREVRDPSYYQETFSFTILISMSKDIGGSRDETKNDIRALPEVLTVTLIEQEKGGIQRDLGTKYLSTLKLHVRLPKGAAKELMMKRLILLVNNLRGVSVLRYKEHIPKQRRKAFHGTYKITEREYQKSPKRKRRLSRAFNRLTKGGPNDAGPYKAVEDDPDWKSAPPGAPGGLEEVEEEPGKPTPNKDLNPFDKLYEDVLITIGTDHSDLMAFDVQPDLNQKIWNKEVGVLPGVKGALMDIVEEFLEGLDVDAEIKDIIITGSLANYNWSKFSDIDIHILIDFEEVNENKEMVKKFFDSVRSNWNKMHDIRVKGHEVEIYVQDEHEPHVSTGVYSLLNDAWLVKPKKVRPAIDRHNATKKMKSLAREIDKLSATFDMGAHEAAFAMAERIKEKIKRMRHAGLDRTGIYSPENLAFKMLRRSGDIEQLFSIYTQAYDKIYSLNQ